MNTLLLLASWVVAGVLVRRYPRTMRRLWLRVCDFAAMAFVKLGVMSAEEREVLGKEKM